MINEIKEIFRIITNKDIIHSKIGYCNICGKFSIFICIDIITARNNMMCIFCRSTSRNRHVAKILIEKTIGKNHSSISKIRKKNENIKIYNTSIGDAISKNFNGWKSFTSSDYLPNLQYGTKISENAYCQNLEELSFKNNFFDILITQDVFEHIRNYEKAFTEVYRVLKTGGFHIFTIPFYFDKPTKFLIDTSGKEDIFLYPPEYHGDPLGKKIITYRTFGIDIFKTLEKIGFKTSLTISQFVDKKFGIYNSYVFISQKK